MLNAETGVGTVVPSDSIIELNALGLAPMLTEKSNKERSWLSLAIVFLGRLFIDSSGSKHVTSTSTASNNKAAKEGTY
jgi:hypothetical protein